MTEKSAKPAGASSSQTAGPASRVRRISNSRPKAESQKGGNAIDGADAASTPERPGQSGFPEFPETPESPEVSTTQSSADGWPEPEVASSGGSSSEGTKRRRRRKKGKGGGVQNAVAQSEGEPTVQAVDEKTATQAAHLKPQAKVPRQNQAPRVKIDAEALAKCAWKIYLAEISEEGVELVGDNDAKELARRCFRLAEIFLEEQARRC